MSESGRSFAVLLRVFRGAAALSQEELAERAGLSRNGVSDLERGRRQTPRLATVRLLADALDLTDGERAALLAAARPTAAVTADPAVCPAYPGVLPVPLARIIGREAELAAVRAGVLDADIRLLTLTGPGGVGKTRLAVASAAAMVDAFPDGVAFVDLSPLNDCALVLPAIAAALGVQEVAGQALQEALAAFLARRRLLLVVDNCERVLMAAPDVAALLGRGAGSTILATSREPLHVHGERVLPVGPLLLPTVDRLPPIEAIARVPAVALFVERARAVQADFALTPANADAVAAICHRLDGLPLAIELSAARIKLLPPTALLARLDRRMPLLVGGPRDHPARLRTMRDAIAWSYDLLAREEQHLFRLVSVFVGGFTLEGVEAAMGAPLVHAAAGRSGVPAVLDLLEGLIDKSLVQRMPSSGLAPRFAMLETIREFALERLAESGEASATADAHAAYYVDLAEREAPDPCRQHDIVDHVALFDAEHANLRQAVDHLAARRPESAQRLAGQLAWFWYLRSHLSVGRDCLARAIAAGPTTSPRTRSLALAGFGQMAIFQGDLATAEAAFETALTLALEANDLSGIAYAEQGQAVLALYQADSESAIRLALQSASHFEDAGDPRHSVSGRFVAARALLFAGDIEAADARLRALLAEFTGFPYVAGMAGSHLADIAVQQGRPHEALAHYATALGHLLELGARWNMAESLEGMASAFAALGRPRTAARLFGAASSIRAAAGLPLLPANLPGYESIQTALSTALGRAGFADAFAAGQDLSPAAAIAEGAAAAHQIPTAAHPQWTSSEFVDQEGRPSPSASAAGS